jgi:hypothetical protein
MATKKKAKKASKRAAKKHAKGSGKKARVAPARKAARRPARKPARVQARKARTASKATARKPKKHSAKKPAVKRAAAKKPAATMRREDRAGHLDPRYAAGLHARSRSDREPRGPDGFIDKPRASDTLVEELGEEYVKSANSGEYEAEDTQNQDVTEEVGGPFVQTSGDQEFARGTDASNPKGSTREPFPRT